MKSVMICLALLLVVAAVAQASPVLLGGGDNSCRFGPSYWCSHVDAALECNAIDYCIQKDWSLIDGNTSESDSDKCNYCEELVTVVQNMLAGNVTERDIEIFVKTVCSLLPIKVTRDMCLQAEKALPIIFEMLRKGLSPKAACTAIGMCSKMSNEIPEMVEEEVLLASPEVLERSDVGDSVLCEACEMLITEVQQMLKDNATVQELEQLADELCEQLGSMADECMSYVKQYLPLVIMYIESQQSQVVCASIGLCDNDIQSLTEWVELVRVALTLKHDAQSPSLMVDLVPGSEISTGKVAGTGCVLCQFVMKELDYILSNEYTEEDIEDALEKVCSLLPATISSECEEFVAEYAAEVIQLLVSELDPEAVCAALSLCSSSQRTPTADLEDGTQCALCEFIMNELDKMLSDKATQAEIEAALEQVCSFFPSSISSECDSYVQQYGPLIIQLLVNEIETAQICTLIGMCTSTEEVVTPVEVKTVEASPQCVLCEFIMRELDSLLKDNATDAEIITALYKVCSMLPSSISGECRSFVDEYGDAVIDLLVQELDPAVVCTVLGLCSSSVNNMMIDPVVECEVCELVFMFSKMLIEEGNETIEHALEKVCNYVTSEKSSQCNALISKYWSILVEILTKTIDPKEVCQTLDVCPSNAVRNMVGVDKCSYGPSYWCSNKDQAIQCNALSHCMKYVWSL